MTESMTCPKCGAELPFHSPAGICPKCLMQAGLASEQDAGLSSEMKPTRLTSGFVPPEPEELAKHFPQLEILELLGKGGMGAVYKARQRELDRLVAVKILPPEIGADPAFAERFTREARALARLNHQNIVQVYDFGRNDEFFYFIMEFVDGLNLRHTIQVGGLEPVAALAIVPQVCEALQFAHDEGIVHRDIKPENILIDKRGRVKIADFGLAKLLGQAPAEFPLTGTHQVMGTLHYMAPEQMQGSRAVDHRADIYSLGVVFYEMLTGQLPIGRFEPPSNKVQIDVRLDEVVLRSLESEPDRRYQHASDITTDLDALSSTPTQHPLPTVTDSARSRRFAAILTGFGIAVPTFAIEQLASSGISPIVTWPIVVLFIVIPASLFAQRNRGTPIGYAAGSVALILALYPFYSVLNGFFSNSEPTLTWLYRTTGITPGPHDATVIRILYVISVVTGLAMSCLGFWYFWRLIRPEVRAGEDQAVTSSIADVAERESSRANRWVEPELKHKDVRPDRRYQHPTNMKTDMVRVVGDVRLRPVDKDRAVFGAVAQPGTHDSHRSIVPSAADALAVIGSMSLACAVIGIVMVLLQRWQHFTGPQPATHVANSIHGVWIIATSMLMRRLKWRPFVVFSVVGVGIAMPVFLALLWVEYLSRAMPILLLNSPWLLVIPQWIGVPVAVWALVVLLQPRVRDEFDAESINRKRLNSATLAANPAPCVFVKSPAIGLIVTGTLHLACLLLIIAPAGISSLELLLLLLPLTVGILLVVGGTKMLRMQSEAWAVTASILALLPVGPGWLVGLPVGVWSLIVLGRQEVRTAFAAKHREQSNKPAECEADATPEQLAHMHIKAPAIGLLVVGTLSLVSPIFVIPAVMLLGVTGSLPAHSYDNDFGHWLAVGSATAGMYATVAMPLGAVVIVGALAMKKLMARWLAITAGILAILPLNLVWPVSLPIGIWVLVVLNKPIIESAFKAQRIDPALLVTRIRRFAKYLRITGIIALVSDAVLLLMYSGGAIAANQWEVAATTTILLPLFVIPGVLLIRSARRMEDLESRRSAITASIVAMVPFSPAWLIGLPFGLWSLAMLTTQEGKTVFVCRTDHREVDATAESSRSDEQGAVPTRGEI